MGFLRLKNHFGAVHLVEIHLRQVCARGVHFKAPADQPGRFSEITGDDITVGSMLEQYRSKAVMRNQLAWVVIRIAVPCLKHGVAGSRRKCDSRDGCRLFGKAVNSLKLCLSGK